MMIDNDNKLVGLGTFFITRVILESGALIIWVDSDIAPDTFISFAKQEAFQVFHESDYHSLHGSYETSRLIVSTDDDCGIFEVKNSPYFDIFLHSNGRYLDGRPTCYLIATADECVEIISFEKPKIVRNTVLNRSVI